jgi:heat shock protein HslJ
MKKIFTAILTVLCLSFVLNCSSAAVKKSTDPERMDAGFFCSYSKEELIKSNAKIDLTSPLENGK